MYGIIRYQGLELVSTDVPPPILTTTPRSERLLTEVRNLNHVFTNWYDPALITCETTCDAEVCDPVLRMDIPGPAANETPIIKYLPKDNLTELYLLRDFNISRKERNIIAAKFIIAPRNSKFDKVIATCQ
jgi:hypothetical protein